MLVVAPLGEWMPRKTRSITSTREAIMLRRQGDLFIEDARSIPSSAVKQSNGVLAEGELTGHRHQVADMDGIAVYEYLGEWYVDVQRDVTQIVHEEHAPISLPFGTYRVWRQREYDPLRNRRDRPVLD
jgi:hypothetical protein